jgi:flagellar protein FlaG
MNEPTVTRPIGSDAPWSGWSPAPGRGGAPRPDAVRPEAAQARRPLPGATGSSDAPADAERLPGAREPHRDAAFPSSYARFSINPDTQKLSIKIVDAVTDEVIREIPSEQVQRIAEDLQSLARRGSIGKQPAGAAGAGVDRYV